MNCLPSKSQRPHVVLLQVIWYHNERPVKESKDFQLLFEGDRCSLVINEVYLEDSGEYKCAARNVHGAAESKCRLIVDREYQENYYHLICIYS